MNRKLKLALPLLSFLIALQMTAQELGPAPYQLMPEQVQGTRISYPEKPVAPATLLPTCNRQAIIDDYNTNYVGSNVTTAELAWTGAVAGCAPGTGSALSVTRTLQRINYFRRLVGLQDNITFDQASYEAGCQASSLIMSANGALSHTPPNTWACWTNLGYTTAEKANIALGIQSSGAITGYILDYGAGNEFTGHRRWIFYSRASVFGTGSTSNANSLRVLSVPQNNSPVLPTFTAYPSAGYFPRSIMPTRWSFGISGANFSGATVTVTDEAGVAISGIVQHPYVAGYGDNTKTWEMPSSVIPSTGNQDVVFNVTVSGITGASQSFYTYKIIAISEVAPTTTATAVHPTCGSNGSATVTFSAGAKTYLWSNGTTTATANNLAIGTYSVTVTDKNDCPYTTSINLTDNSAASIRPGSALPASTANVVGSAVTLNLSSTGATNLTSDKVVGWWITSTNPITSTVTSPATLTTALGAALVEPASVAPSNTSFLYKSTSGTSLTKAYTCGTHLNSSTTYYATPFVSDYVAPTSLVTCAPSVTGTAISVGGIGTGRRGTIAGSAFSCGSTAPTTFSLVITISGHSGAAINFNVRPSDNSSTFAFPSLAGNGTVTLTQADFPANYNPKTSGVLVLAYQGSGGSFPASTVLNLQFTISYPATAGIPFPTVNYATCTFGTPLSFTCGAPLPIELLYLKGKNNGQENTLTWATASEKNNAFFELQRSHDGILFELIGKTKGAGTSSETHHYAMVDNTFTRQTNYYRIRQTDEDGKQTYSHTISIDSDKKTGLTIYPNPTTGTVQILTANDLEEQVELVNSIGEIVLKTRINKAITLDLSPFPVGIYVLRTSNGEIHKITKY